MFGFPLFERKPYVSPQATTFYFVVAVAAALASFWLARGNGN